jgi:hypothetical protein
LEAAAERVTPKEQLSSAGDVSPSDAILEAIDQPWSQQISLLDPRFGSLLPPGSGTIYERIESLTSQPQDDDVAERELANSIQEVKQRIAGISRLTLERALADFVSAVSRKTGRALDALLARLGFLGQPPATLEDAGVQLGVTRERIRQIQKSFSERLPEHPVFMPALDEAIQQIQSRAPLEVEAAQVLLQKAGLTTGRFHPLSLISAAETCGRSKPFVVEKYGDRERISVADSLPRSHLISLARKQAGASGASNLSEVIAEAKVRNLDAPSPVELHDWLSAFSDIEFLDETWFWCPGGNRSRNRLSNTARKMLSVAAPIHVNSLREGVRRLYRYRRDRGTSRWPLIVPPRAIMARFFEQHPEFRLDGDGNVCPVESIDYHKELGSIEASFVEILRASPACVLDRSTLAKACTRKGVNQNTFSLFLTYSAVIEHLGTDLWSLRGVRVDPAAVEAVRVANAVRPKERRILDHGWDEAGRLWLAIRIPAEYSSLVCGVPSVLRHLVAGRQFTATDETGTPFGSVRIQDDGVSLGYGSFLKTKGADEDDILLASFDLVRSTVILQLTDDEGLADGVAPENPSPAILEESG